MTQRQTLILFLVYCDTGLRDIYSMVKFYDRADFPFQVGENLKPLLDGNLIFVSKYFDNGTPAEYRVTEEGRTYVNQKVNEEDIISYIKTLQYPDQLLFLAKTCFDKRRGYITRARQ